MNTEMNMSEMKALFLVELHAYFSEHKVSWYDADADIIVSEDVDLDTLAIVEFTKPQTLAAPAYETVYARFVANGRTLLADVGMVNGKIDWCY